MAENELDEPWEPNYKVKFKSFDPRSPDGVQSEAEIPEKYRKLITDPESEKEVRELFEKANGLDYVKETRAKFKNERDQVLGHVDQVHKRLADVDAHIAGGDLDTAFQTMGIQPEKVLHWVLDKIQYSQLEPAQRQAIDSQRATEARTKTLEQQNQELAQSHMKAIVSAKDMGLNAMLQRPDISEVVAAYDSRAGRRPQDPSLRDLVINHGELTWHRSGGKIDLSPQECVEAVLRDYGIADAYRSSNGSVARAAAPAAPASREPARQQPQQTLPNVSGRATSPTAPRITTKAQLLEHRKKILGM